ncbi:hypothetical protein BH10PSE17_BH10PSE17_23340 [soil metagenome]
MNIHASTDSLLARWQQAWPEALAIWSRYTRLQHPQLCESRVAAAAEGLDGSFAMIRFKDQRVVIDLPAIRALKLDECAVEILAHEIGHHVLIPANLTDQFRLLARIRAGLPTLAVHAPMVANLYADLIINDRLQRQSSLRMADIYRRLASVGDKGSSETSAVWNLYLRIYENLWKLPIGDLGARQGDSRTEGDAWLGARVIRVYANDWLTGASRFAALLLPYLVDDAEREPAPAIRHLMDATNAAAGSEPVGGIDIDAADAGEALHPADDPAVTGEDDSDGSEQTVPPDADQPPIAPHGQTREPFEYGELLRSAGIALTDHEIAVRYYREAALPHLVPFPKRHVPGMPEPLLEGLEPWSFGDAFEEFDALQSVLMSPRVIPGVTTVRRQYGQEPGRQLERRPVDLDLYVDSSGSMPNPQQRISYPSLAGAVIALSALRSGSRVQVTLWSGKQQFMQTDGFVRDEHDILRVLTGFFGGGTAFPIHLLRAAHEGAAERDRSTHILMISDDGISTMFDRDELGNDGWTVSAEALEAAGGGGSMALNIPSSWEAALAARSADVYAPLQRARLEQGWEIFAIQRLEDLLEFARAFSRRHYA